MQQTVLISTLGSEPQVVTLALDALIAMDIAIDRVDVVHTHPNYEPIYSALKRLQQEFVINRVYSNIQYVTHPLMSDNGILTDVVSTQDIEDAFNSLYLLIRQHKRLGNTIHLCIAGGRKTTTVFALSVAYALFDNTDYIWHLVSHPSIIQSKVMHASKGVQLIPVPFLNLSVDDTQKQHVLTFLSHVLTDVEREIVILMIREGLTNREIAERLHKSIKTVANQLTTIYEKMYRHFALKKPADRATLFIILQKYIA